MGILSRHPPLTWRLLDHGSTRRCWATWFTDSWLSDPASMVEDNHAARTTGEFGQEVAACR